MQIKVTITNSSRYTSGKVMACFIYVCGNKFRLTNVQVSFAAVLWMSRNAVESCVTSKTRLRGRGNKYPRTGGQ